MRLIEIAGSTSPASSSRTHYVWRYVIRLENEGTETLSLRGRDWKLLTLGPNKLERLPERSVVGYEPCLSPAQPVFQVLEVSHQPFPS